MPPLQSCSTLLRNRGLVSTSELLHRVRSGKLLPALTVQEDRCALTISQGLDAAASFLRPVVNGFPATRPERVFREVGEVGRWGQCGRRGGSRGAGEG